MVTDDIDHDGAFWGIGFPVRSLSFDQPAVDIVEEYLEGSGFAILNAGLQGLDLAIVLPAVVTERDWKVIEHKTGFSSLIE
jgi:hypothetical protein